MVYQITEGDLKFGASLMNHLRAGNASISPYNIRTALSMLYEGARDKAAKEIADTAMIPVNDETRLKEVKLVSEEINGAARDYVLKSANGIWIENTFALKPEFKDRVVAAYMAEVNSADFRGNAEKERQRINKWVAAKTENKIEELFPAGSMKPLTVLALASALYFKAPWLGKFDSAYTRKQDFMLSNGNNVQVDMMRKGSVEGKALPKFMYGFVEDAEVAILPYKGRQLEKIIMLPSKNFVKKFGIRKLEDNIRNGSLTLNEIYMRSTRKEFSRLELPKHEMKCNYDLIPALQKLGIESIFSDDDGLGGIGEGPLYVSSAVHQTYFKTDEAGSEGAAATGMTISLRCCINPVKEEPVNFIADRPFLEAIVHQPTGAVLFLNRVEDPR